jgi:hypothetical protein
VEEDRRRKALGPRVAEGCARRLCVKQGPAWPSTCQEGGVRPRCRPVDPARPCLVPCLRRAPVALRSALTSASPLRPSLRPSPFGFGRPCTCAGGRPKPKGDGRSEGRRPRTPGWTSEAKGALGGYPRTRGVGCGSGGLVGNMRRIKRILSGGRWSARLRGGRLWRADAFLGAGGMCSFGRALSKGMATCFVYLEPAQVLSTFDRPPTEHLTYP